MDRQTAFADIENASRRRATKREAFLEAMDAAVPWAELIAAVEPFHYPGKRGRRPIGVERMLHMYFLQLWSSLSDEGVEDAICNSRAFSRFMGVRFGLGDWVPLRHRALEVPPHRRGERPGRRDSGEGQRGPGGQGNHDAQKIAYSGDRQ